MIKKIQNGEYLTRYDNMTAQERESYESRVGQWLNNGWPLLEDKCDTLEARLQNVLQVSTAWNDQECLAFEDGVRLLSAQIHTGETWLPDMLYIKSAKRVLRQMVNILTAVVTPVMDIPEVPEVTSLNVETITKEQAQHIAMKYTEKKEGEDSADSSFQDNTGNGDIAGGNQQGEGKKEDVRGKAEDDSAVSHQPSAIVPPRPKHIDQYVHLLPKKTQEHAALVQGLYRELDEARHKLELLMDDPTANARDREAWAKKATKCDNTLKKIFVELDTEWAKLVESGRVVVDDLGNARVMEEGRGEMSDGRWKKEDNKQNNPRTSENTPDSTSEKELTSEQKARRRDLRKWLVDTRRGNGAARDERVKQWYKNFKEYLTLEGDAAFKDEKILEAIKHYEIDTKKLKKE
jgi:hypothetical protein